MSRSFRQMADEYFAAKLACERAERVLFKLKDEILTSGRAELVGADALVTVTEQKRETLDSAAVKALLTPRQIEACTKTSTSRVIRVKATANEEMV